MYSFCVARWSQEHGVRAEGQWIDICTPMKKEICSSLDVISVKFQWREVLIIFYVVLSESCMLQHPTLFWKSNFQNTFLTFWHHVWTQIVSDRQVYWTLGSLFPERQDKKILPLSNLTTYLLEPVNFEYLK